MALKVKNKIGPVRREGIRQVERKRETRSV